MHKEVEDYIKLQRKLFVLKYATLFKTKKEAYLACGVPKSTFYDWKKAYDEAGEEGLKQQKPGDRHHPGKLSQEVVDKILELRKIYKLGSIRITWYLDRYHGIKTSESSVRRILVRYKLNRLPENTSRRTVHTKRYNKNVPGHHVQVDVKFLNLEDQEGKKIRRFQYTAIDDATRIRALQIYNRHNQQNAINFVDYVIEKFPFRIHTIRTDRGHEFQAKFHWDVEDRGITHVYIKPKSPQLNGKVERSHRTDQQEFYQLLSYTGDVDLNEKLDQWEQFYNFNRPHGAHDGKTPYEALKCFLEKT